MGQGKQGEFGACMALSTDQQFTPHCSVCSNSRQAHVTVKLRKPGCEVQYYVALFRLDT